MATKASIEKSRKTPKYLTRVHHRCRRCGRPRGFMRDFGLCRICFRELALKQQIPGITKSSW